MRRLADDVRIAQQVVKKIINIKTSVLNVPIRFAVSIANKLNISVKVALQTKANNYFLYF